MKKSVMPLQKYVAAAAAIAAYRSIARYSITAFNPNSFIWYNFFVKMFWLLCKMLISTNYVSAHQFTETKKEKKKP